MQRSRYGLAAGLLLTATSALAQTPAAPPAATAPAESGGMGWLWAILVLLVIAGAAWYFLSGRNRSTTTTTTGIDSDRIAGSATQAKGSFKEGVGNLTGDAKLQAEGRMDQVEGRAQNTVGGIKDTLRDKT